METINFEELVIDDDFVTALDDDGMITIQLSVDSVNKIINEFDKHITNKNNHVATITISEFGETFNIELKLTFEEDGFNLIGTRDDSLYRDFELEYCDNISWYKIKNLCS